MSVERRDQVTVVSVTGSLDADNVHDLEQELAGSAESEGRAEATVIDLSALEFADSSVLHALLAAQRRHKALGKRLVLCGPFRPVVHRLFDVTGTAEFFDMAEDIGTVLPPAR
ncbi:STAS domain-containing protein [Streptomyces flavofungini]|uniref:STAS domain-containing protein n=1 Tax=Streptomyces flavofungini TaxID=68200 RepID=UPI0034DFEFA2